MLQRAQLTVNKIPTTHNSADVLTKHLPATIAQSHLDRLCLQTTTMTKVGALLATNNNNNNNNNKFVEKTTTALILEPRCFTTTIPWSFFLSLIATIFMRASQLHWLDNQSLSSS
eukprot:2458612-Amphidinium_carterae.2